MLFPNITLLLRLTITYKGASNVAASLRAAAIFFKVGGDWDWFVTLSAANYPLLTQDAGEDAHGNYEVWHETGSWKVVQTWFEGPTDLPRMLHYVHARGFNRFYPPQTSHSVFKSAVCHQSQTPLKTPLSLSSSICNFSSQRGVAGAGITAAVLITGLAVAVLHNGCYCL